MTEPSMPPALADDPFWRVVRERHPDLDIVILPDPEPAPTEPIPGTYERACWLYDGCESTLAVIQERVGRDFDARTGIWVHGDRTGQRQYVATAAITDFDDAGPVRLMRAIGDALLDEGWDARPSVDGTLSIRAVGEEKLARIEGTASMIAIEVRGAALPLTDAEAAELEKATA